MSGVRPVYLFCDLDGVLADFYNAVIRITGKPIEYHQKQGTKAFGAMWKQLGRAEVYAHLDWETGGEQLWGGIRHLKPSILTGMPQGNWADGQKRYWCTTWLGPDVHVITCMSRDKPQVAQAHISNATVAPHLFELNLDGLPSCVHLPQGEPPPPPKKAKSAHAERPSLSTSILIDDTDRMVENWTHNGGIAIHHKSLPETLGALRTLGFAIPDGAVER